MANTTPNSTWLTRGPLGSAGTITGASNTTPIVITQARHPYATGNLAVIASVGGNTAANATSVVQVIDANSYSLYTQAGAALAGNGAYTSGGTSQHVTGTTFLAGAQDALEFAYVGQATTTGDASSASFTVNFIDGTLALPFTPSAVVGWRTGGAATASISLVSCTAPSTTSFTATASTTINAATFTITYIAFK